jgi:hypothetical protein
MGHKYFYLIKRADEKGVYYARFVLDKPFGGSQVMPWVSTGETDERKAADWAASHGPMPKRRIPLGESMPFSAFAAGWWTTDDDYVRRQVARGFSLGGNYLKQCRSLLANHILPTFGPGTVAINTENYKTSTLQQRINLTYRKPRNRRGAPALMRVMITAGLGLPCI